MATTYSPERSSARRALGMEAGGAATESMGGVAVIALTILALVGIVPTLLTPIAGIVFGAAFVIEGAAIAAQQKSLMAQAVENPLDQVETGAGVSVEVATGLAAIVLGILALVGVSGPVLTSCLVIAGGAGLIVSAGAVQRLNHLRMNVIGAGPTVASISGAAVSGAAGGQVLAGLAAVTLGILALIGVSTWTLATIGLLVLGASITLSGTALSSRMLRLFQHS